MSPALLAMLQRIARETALLHMAARRLLGDDGSHLPDYHRPYAQLQRYGRATAQMRRRGWATRPYH